ncbi:2-hydroxychromene-2-carboxylate isomerase [Azoarcus sp. L1K30]|uniref:2-hydroxychromene-2-carboxylate isomerase n=1 Tax=Azoarcus sp. L1K30 TaxID=2820277 RepID=UPI0032C242E1
MNDAVLPIDFWFDFSSPYGYLMAESIDAVAAAHGRTVRWRPFLLGAVYKAVGGQPLTSIPLKGPYSIRDLARSARFLGVPFSMPQPFPVPTQHAARAFYHLEQQEPALARRFALAVYRDFFVDGHDISVLEQVLDVAASVGVERAALAQALAGDEARARLKAVCDEALALGVFGSPYVIIDGEPFWGVDRLPQIERWLASGGF